MIYLQVSEVSVYVEKYISSISEFVFMVVAYGTLYWFYYVHVFWCFVGKWCNYDWAW